jgi:putative hydrolase of the HAD superfamily
LKSFIFETLIIILNRSGKPLSLLADFASRLHEKTSALYSTRSLEPVQYPSKSEKLSDVRAVIFDVYGTLVNYWKPGIEDTDKRSNFFKEAFRKVADQFGFTPFLVEMDPEADPEKTLYDLYHGLIALSHEKAIKEEVQFPEVKIEDVWGLILLMLKRRGYDPKEFLPDDSSELARYCAFCYNFYSLGRGFYPQVIDALSALKKSNIELGILSNAQFYTPLDLTLFVREQSRGALEDYNELFNSDLTFYSYEYGVAKPNVLLFRKLYDVLYEYHILPEQTVFVGNDLVLDIEPAAKVGMRTALFVGDSTSAYFHDQYGKIIPDITFSAWEELPHKLSFFSEGSGQE